MLRRIITSNKANISITRNSSRFFSKTKQEKENVTEYQRQIEEKDYEAKKAQEILHKSANEPHQVEDITINIIPMESTHEGNTVPPEDKETEIAAQANRNCRKITKRAHEGTQVPLPPDPYKE